MTISKREFGILCDGTLVSCWTLKGENGLTAEILDYGVVIRSVVVPDKNGTVEVVNLKCAPEVIESVAGVEPGVYRAYHMNKTHWLTLALCECDEATVSWFLSISYDLTQRKKKAR